MQVVTYAYDEQRERKEGDRLRNGVGSEGKRPCMIVIVDCEEQGDRERWGKRGSGGRKSKSGIAA